VTSHRKRKKRDAAAKAVSRANEAELLGLVEELLDVVKWLQVMGYSQQYLLDRHLQVDDAERERVLEAAARSVERDGRLQEWRARLARIRAGIDGAATGKAPDGGDTGGKRTRERRSDSSSTTRADEGAAERPTAQGIDRDIEPPVEAIRERMAESSSDRAEPMPERRRRASPQGDADALKSSSPPSGSAAARSKAERSVSSGGGRPLSREEWAARARRRREDGDAGGAAEAGRS
jgi:hypothetical protein